MRLPLISIIITTYNYAHTVGTAIKSALAQDYPNIEVVVMDNASTDATPAVLAAFSQDRRLRYIRNPTNIGMVPNHNEGLRHASGEYVAFLSADDFLMPHFVSRSYAYLQAHPEIDVLYGSTYFVDEHEKFFGFRQMTGQPFAAYHGGRNEFASLLMEGCYMCFPTMLMRRELYDRHGLLDESIKAADFEIVLRWAEAGVRFAYDPEPVCAVRLHSGQQSSAQNYYANGGDIKETLYLFRKFVRPENEHRIAGYERRIAYALQLHSEMCKQSGFDDAETKPELGSALQELEQLRQRNLARPRASRLTVVVLAGGTITALAETLESLVAQTHDDWEALVVQNPGMSWGPLCRRLDPRGRIRPIAMTQLFNDPILLNTALRIAGGNAYAFARAGTVWASDHVEKLLRAFDAGAEVALARPVLVFDAQDGSLTKRRRLAYRSDIYPWPNAEDLSAIGAAVPLDALAFTTRALDGTGPFNEHISTFEDWEMFLRLRPFGVTAIDSTLEIRQILGAASRSVTHVAMIQIARAIHKAYPSGDPIVSERRRTYVATLETMFSGAMPNPDTPEGLTEIYRAIAGSRWISPPSRIAAAR